MPAAAFGFTKLVVSDLDGVARFYREVFGLEERHRVSTEEHSYALDEVILAPPDSQGNHALIIVRYRERPCPPAGAAWTGFVVDDMASALARVEAHGGRVEVTPHESRDHGAHVIAAIAADPAGHLIELIQILAPAP